MKYNIMMTCPAWCYCTVEAASEEELKDALLHHRYQIYDEDIGDTEHYYIMDIDGEDASEGVFPDRYFPEVRLEE